MKTDHQDLGGRAGSNIRPRVWPQWRWVHPRFWLPEDEDGKGVTSCCLNCTTVATVFQSRNRIIPSSHEDGAPVRYGSTGSSSHEDGPLLRYVSTGFVCLVLRVSPCWFSRRVLEGSPSLLVVLIWLVCTARNRVVSKADITRHHHHLTGPISLCRGRRFFDAFSDVFIWYLFLKQAQCCPRGKQGIEGSKKRP